VSRAPKEPDKFVTETYLPILFYLKIIDARLLRRNKTVNIKKNRSDEMRRRVIRASLKIAVTACCLLVVSCAKKHKTARVPAAPPPSRAAARVPPKHLPVGYMEEGVASWYGIPYHGRPAADGEIYDMEKLVAAHRLMPFNTWLKVTNLTNNKSVNVRVIDRGPFVDGRIIDLSKAAARQINLLGPGTGPVRLEVIAAPKDIPLNDFYAVQVGAFSVYANADRLRSEYAQRFGSAELTVKEGATPLWRVLVGKASSIEAAQDIETQLRVEGKNVFVVRLDTTLPAPNSAAQPPSR
jgi:rare lipoprotein A